MSRQTRTVQIHQVSFDQPHSWFSVPATTKPICRARNGPPTRIPSRNPHPTRNPSVGWMPVLT